MEDDILVMGRHLCDHPCEDQPSPCCQNCCFFEDWWRMNWRMKEKMVAMDWVKVAPEQEVCKTVEGEYRQVPHG